MKVSSIMVLYAPEKKMKFEASTTLPEQIAKYLEDRIIRREIKPGERLVETKIADELGVSQSPMREALRMLEKVRLVRLTPRHGARVTEITEDFIISIYDIFQVLVGLATRKTVERHTEIDIIDIRNLLVKIRYYSQLNDIFNFNEMYFQWGIRCLKAAYDPLLEEHLIDLVPSIRRLQYISLLKQEPQDIFGIVEKMLYTTNCIEKGLIKEAELNNCTEVEREKNLVLQIFRQFTE